MKISNKKINRIELIASQLVLHFSAVFLNPKYRGPSFKWSKFESHVQRHGEQYFHECSNDIEKQFLINTISSYSKEFLETSGLLTNEDNVEST